MLWPKNKTAERIPWKLLLWTAVAGLVFGLIGFGEVAEDFLRVARNSLHKHPASGQIALVTIDDKSLHKVGRWPWPRRYHAVLTDAIDKAGAKAIYFDIVFSGSSNASDDQAFANALLRAGDVTLAAKAQFGPDKTRLQDQDDVPAPILARHARLGSISIRYNYQNAVWSVPYSNEINGKQVPSFSASLAGVKEPSGKYFMPDYSLDLSSIPVVSASDLFENPKNAAMLRGKTVIVGTTNDAGNDKFYVPGIGKVGGVYLHIVGAETLKSGTPVDWGWAPAFVLSLIATTAALTFRRRRTRLAVLGVIAAAFLLGPVLLEARLISVDITPSLFVIVTVIVGLTWQRFRLRGLVNHVSNLPNLNALRLHRAGRKQSLVAARILNYEEALATLPPDSERQLVEQIVSRLSVGSTERVLYQGDGGIFAWFADPRQPFGNHLEALHALFRNPARVSQLSVDLAVAFGVEVGSSRSLDSRLASALVAADQAARDGLKWCYHDPDTLEDAAWRLSMLSQLDSAIDKGEVWIAYQPKLDLASKKVIGAEALARWTHPEKGPIAASEFVAAAEQNNRIAKLTDFVLDHAIKAAAEINGKGDDFEMAVNMSARLMSDKHFLLRLSAALARNGLAPRHLTLELTETAALASAGEGLAMIGQLRDMGIRISIDDYGTGLSTLDYLKRVPASEIKIDQSFIKGIVENRSDRLMVHSTIQLAHSLGRRVVAEGVEQREIVDVLVELGCDVGQGYALGRPMSLESLMKRLASDRKRDVA